MLSSKTLPAHLLAAAFVRGLLLGALLLTGPLALADTSWLDGDMGLASSSPNNSLIDNNSIAPDPLPPTLSPAQAAALVRNQFGGQVMSVNTQRRDAGIIYGVKLLNDGRMRVIHVDGQTGQLLPQ